MESSRKPAQVKGRREQFLLVAILLFSGAARIATLGMYALTDTTEARYGEIAREMAVTGDWVTPRIDLGRPFWAKPPLSTWASAGSIRVFGVNEFAARVPSLLFVAATAALTYLVARRLRDHLLGLVAAVIVATSALGFGLAGAVMTDAALGFTTTLVLAGFFFALDGPGTRHGAGWGLAGFAGIGLGLLAKGPVALVLVGLPVFVWVLWTRRWRELGRSLPWVGGTLLAAAIAVPWYLLAESRTPGFLRYFVVGEHFGRFLDPHWSGDMYGAPRVKPRGAIWVLGLGAFLPWTLALIAALARRRSERKGAVRRIAEDPRVLLLVLWALAPFVFFTIDGSAMAYYVQPALPAFAILTALLVSDATGRLRNPRAFTVAAMVVPLISIVAAPVLAPTLWNQHSQAGLLETAARLGGPESVVAYSDTDVPDSADFYSRGTARHMASAGPEAWDALLASSRPVFVAARQGRGVPARCRSHCPDAPVERFDRFELWQLTAEAR